MKTVDIKGKQYVMVNERLKAFREQYSGLGLLTEIIELTSDSCTMQAKIIDGQGHVIAMGTAREEREDKSSMVNKTSYVENCETSAWGRALGNFGIGIDESIASADEVARAIEKQDRMDSNSDKSKNTVPEDMTLEEAYRFTTKSGKPFGSLTIEQLEYIIDHGRPESSLAAHLVKEDMENNDDMQPIGDLPF